MSFRLIWIAAACVGLLAAGAFAEPLVLMDFEDGDGANYRGGEFSTEQVKTGKTSLKWADHSTNKVVYFKGLPTDWSAYNQLSFWAYSEKANDAGLVLIVRSENEDVEGIDYFSYRFPVDWTGWRRIEISFAAMPASRKPKGWGEVNYMQIVGDGWGNEAKPDTVLYFDDFELEKVPVKLLNGDFEGDADADGVPKGWRLFSAVRKETQEAHLVDGGRSGKGFLLRDDTKEASLGLMQYVPAEPGKTYRFSVYKKGSPVGLYIKSFDANRKQVKTKSASAKNQNRDAFEEFSIEDTAAPEAAMIQVIIYFAKVSRGQCVVDDAKIEKVD